MGIKLGSSRSWMMDQLIEARFGTLLQEGYLVSRASRDEAFRSQFNFGPPNPANDEKSLWINGNRVCCHTPCLPRLPEGRARRSRAVPQECSSRTNSVWLSLDEVRVTFISERYR